ncbi:MAG: nucleoside triphosphate pyrophosphohydrolase [Chloroflexi bacterium]|nr:nucleoside triphosphate pyrophosphohydrolase [Chloroflexota bacterium]
MLDALLAEARRRWSLDPVTGLQLVVAEALAGTPIEPSRPVLVVPASLLGAVVDPAAPVGPLPGRHGPGGADPLAVLGRLYPPTHPVGRLAGPGTGPGTAHGAVNGAAHAPLPRTVASEPDADADPAPGDATVATLAAADLARPFYLSPLGLETALASPWSMPAISHRLRAPDGCPWDQEQTHASLRSHLLEEAYEVYDALAAEPGPALAEELGDLLLQVVLHAQLAAEEGLFDYTDVNAALAAKVVRRHPHVFGEAEARTAADVNRQWERIKAAERAAAVAGSDEPEAETAAAGTARRVGGALDGISRAMPALAASQEMQARAAAIGYDWPTVAGVVAKVHEELAELGAASDQAAREEELGDLLLVVVNLARHHGVDAEAALRAANDKFRGRFAVVERLAAERGVALRDLSFEELDQLWDAAKAELASTAGAGTPSRKETRG